MILNLRNSRGSEMPLFGNEYFTLTDIDGFTNADVAVSSNTMADADGDIVNALTVNPRTVTVTLRVNQGVNPEECKRYVTEFVKLKKEASLYMEYRDRVATLTGVIQSFSMPRFSNSVAIQFSLYCSQPLWEDVTSLSVMISEVLPMHHWAITPKEDADIVMGVIQDANTQRIINEGDVAIGMTMTIIALGNVTNPIIYRDQSDEFFAVDVSMTTRDEMIISTIKGQKSVTLNGESIISKVRKGSTWLQLEVGENVFVIDDNYEAVNMQFQIVARERYV